MSQFRQLRRIVEGACELAGEERKNYVDRECGANTTLRAEVDAILEVTDREPAGPEVRGRGFFASMLTGLADEPDADTHIGGYRLIRRIASGGMGTVWEAEQEEPLRRVAIKALRFGLASTDTVRRFRYEAEILAKLHHPNIAQVYASGVFETAGNGDRVPWYAMEYVQNARTVVEAASSIPREDGLRLFVTLCQAVQHGHERGVIHRDLKPANVLVDAEGHLKIIDFGVARLINASGRKLHDSLDTGAGSLLGTLPYMAPEQIAGKSDGLETRSDVYALGVILFQMLTGELPHEISHANFAEAARSIESRAPPRASGRVRSIPVELDSIVCKSLEPDRARRYNAANALSDDVERFLRGEPVVAQLPGVAYQIRAFARRNKLLVLSAMTVVATLVTASIVSIFFAFWAIDSKRDAVARGEAYRLSAYAANIAVAAGALRDQNVIDARARLDQCSEELRGFEWRHLFSQLDRALYTRPVDGRRISGAVWHPTLPYLYISTRDGRLEQRRASDGARIRQFADFVTGLIDMAIDPLGGKLAAGFDSGNIVIFDGDPPLKIGEFHAHDVGVESLAFSYDGRFLVSSGKDKKVIVWKTADWKKVSELEAVKDRVPTICANADFTLLAGGSYSGFLYLWDLASGKLVWSTKAHESFVGQVAFRRDGKLIASAGYDHAVKTWDVEQRKQRDTLVGNRAVVVSISFDRSGNHLASGGLDRVVRVWDLTTNDPPRALPGHIADINVVSYSPDGSRLVSGDFIGRIKIWDPSSEDVTVVREAGHGGIFLRFNPDASRLLTLRTGTARMSWIDGSGMKLQYKSGGRRFIGGGISADGARTLLVSTDGTAQFFESATGAPGKSGNTGEKSVSCACWNGQSACFAEGTSEGFVTFVDSESLNAVQRDSRKSAIVALASSRDGGVTAAGDGGGTCAIYQNDASGRASAPPQSFAAGGAIGALAVSADSKSIAVGLVDGRIRIWNIYNKSFEGDLNGHTLAVRCLVFSPDGTRLVSGSIDRSVRLWDVRRRAGVAIMTDHSHTVWGVEFSRDGRSLATSSDDETVRVVRAPDAEDLQPPGDLYDQICEAWLVCSDASAGRESLLKARESCKAAMRNPELREIALRAAGAAELRLGEWRAAADFFNESLQMSPNLTARALRILAWVRLGERALYEPEEAELRKVKDREKADMFFGAYDEIKGALARTK
ncbi:MAG: serine/threonine protein kinase [Planctomycetes bacterium]|nr:serine/threonine protein kinase [Planctomycetota bacterium]